MTVATDAELVTRAAAGDREAYTELFRRHVDPVHDHVLRVTGDAALAADATQEAFVTALDKLDQLRDGQAVRAWLLRTARNRAIDQLRKVGREVATTTQTAAAPTALMTVVDDDRATSPEAAAEMSEAAGLVWEVAAGLDERTRSVLDLHVRQGLTGPELAEVLDTTPSNANVLVHRMRERMRELFGAVLLLRTGRSDCEELATLTASLPEPVSLADARRVHAHADECEACEGRRRAAIAPMRAYAAFAHVRAPLAVHAGVGAALDARFGTVPATGAAATRRALLAGLVALVLLAVPAALWAGGGPTTAVPVAGATALEDPPTAAPTPSPTATATASATATPVPTASPTDDPTPTEDPSPDPTPTATPDPTEQPTSTPTPEPTPVTVAVEAPGDGAAVTAVGDPARARVPALATVFGASELDAVAWRSDVTGGTVLLDELDGVLALPLSAPCTDTTHTITVTVDPAGDRGPVTSAPVTVLVTHDCPPPPVVRIDAPVAGQLVRAQPGPDGSSTGQVRVAATSDGDPSTTTWRWTSDLTGATTLSTSAQDTLLLTTDGCDRVEVTLTATATSAGSGASGSASVTVVLDPQCVR